MANYNEEDVQWLYDRMVDDGVDAGTIDDFKESLKSDVDRDWYHKRAKKMGLDVGDADEFKSWTVPEEQTEGSQYTDNGGTVVDQAVDNMNRMAGRMPQDVQDASFNAPAYGQKVNPAGGQATFTEEELAEQIAETQKMNQPSINATDTSGVQWTNAEVANMQNNRKRENPNKGVTYQQKESWTGSYARTPDEFGEMHYGWQRGDRVKRLDKRGLEFAGYGGHKGNQFYNEALDAAERMSDDEIVATYEQMAKSIGPNTDMKWFVGTEEGYKLASQMKALQHELHARDLGFAHDRDVENPGMEDYANVRTDNVVAGVIDNIQGMSPQERDALAQAAYDRGLDSDMSEEDQNVILAVAALRSKDNGRRVEDNYRELQQQMEYHSLYSTLERDMDRIYSEENAAMVQREEDAVGDMVYSGGEGGELAWANARTVEAIKAGNLPHTFDVMTDRILQESEAAQRYYQRRVGELSKGEGVIRARAMARDELRQMFRTKYIDNSPLTPKSDTQYIVQSVFFDNMWSKMSQASLGLAAGEPYHEMKRTLDEGMQMYAQQQASTAARIIAPCAVLVFDAATGSFMPAGAASKGAVTLFGKGVTKGLSWLGKRLYGIGTEAALRRAGENTALRILGGALGGSANFATYEFESELFGGAASGELSAGNLGHAALSGAGKGFVFGFVGGVASKATEGLSGMGALIGEVGTIAAEGTTFTAMDYLQTGQLTPESVGTSFGMAIAGRAAHPVEYATNLLSRVVGLNRKNAPSKPPRISKETAERLRNDYPALTALLSGDGLAKDIAKAIKTKGGKQDAGERLNAIEEEYRRMKQDTNVPWSVVRIAEYVVNGRVIPQPWMMNSEIRTDEDGNEYGVTLDGDGRVIERFKFKNDKQREQWQAATSRQSDINRLSVASQNMRRSEFTDVLESTINEVAEAQGMDANVLRDIILGGDLKKDKAYRRTIKDKAYLSAADDVQKAIDEKLKSTESAVDIAIRAVENKYGISIEQALEYPVYQRTEREAKAVEELQQRLNGDYAPENDMSDAEIIEAEKKRSHDDGYQAEGEQLADVKERLEDAADALAEMRIDPRQFDSMDENAISDWLESRGNNAEEAEAVMEYLNAKAAFEGVRDKVNDEATDRIEQTNRETDERTNKKSGQIHRVTLKPDNENEPGREGFIIDGKITINEDGTVDRENSDKEVVVSYGDGSEPEIRPIEDVLSGERAQDPEQLKKEAADGIVAEVTEKAASQMNRDLPFNLGDVYDVMIEGQPAKATVVGEDPQQPGNVVVDFSNGQRGSVPREALQGMADEYREAQRRPQQPVEEQPVEETPIEEQPTQSAGPRDNTAPVGERPTEEKPAAPAIGGDPMERVAYYRASGKSEERIEKEIANGIEAARQRLEKAQKAWDETKETDEAKLDALERELNDARREVEYWQEVDRYRKASQEPENARAEEPLRNNGTGNRADDGKLPMTADGIDPDAEYSGLGMSFETKERLEDGSGVVGLIDALARELGLKIRTWNGAAGAPGYTDRDNGIIWINNNRYSRGFKQTLGHELIHGLKQEAKRQGKPELYTALRDAVLEHVRMQKGENYDAYYEGMLNLYRKGLFEYGKQRALREGKSESDAVRAGWEAAGVVDKPYIEEEIVCDAIGDLLDGDTESASRMLEGIKDKGLLQSIKDYFINLLNKVKSAFSRGDSAEPTPEEQTIDRVIASFEKMYKDLIEGRREEMKAEAERARIEEQGVHSIEQAAATDGKAFSFRTKDEVDEKARKYAKTTDGKKHKWTAATIDSIIDETNRLIDAIHAALNGDPFYDEFAGKQPTVRYDWRDGELHPTVTWSRNNVEYKYDMSADLLCVNNDGLEEVLSSPMMCDMMVKMFENELAKNGGNTYVIKNGKKDYIAGGFTSDDYISLYNMLRDKGFVVPCRGCFDAAARLKMLPSVSQKFENQVNEAIMERAKDPEAYDAALREEAMQAQSKENERAKRKGEKPKRKMGTNGFPLVTPTKESAIRVAVAADNLTEPITYSQLMSAKGQTEMLSDWGSIFRAWQHTGAGRPKDKLLPEPYIGDITTSTYTIIGQADKKTPNFRDQEVNQGTSLRRNSHSELRPYTIIDEIQFMRDAFIRGLMVFKYMKELDDVRLFGNMGVKFNMSFFPAFDENGTAAGLGPDGRYIAAEESVGAREFPYTGEDGKTHYDGMRGWQEAQRYCNDDVSLSTVIFSLPHMVKVLTDVPTPKDPRGKWGSAIPFHASGATAAQLFKQGLGRARACGTGHPFEEAYTDWDKGVTNFEEVQNDRFGDGWVAVGKNEGKDMSGKKLEFATSSHYYNERLGLHMFNGALVTDEAFPNLKYNKDGSLNKNASKELEGFIPMDIDYNDKVREINSEYGYKEAADYYIQFMQEHGIIPRFDFSVPEDVFLRACAATIDEGTGKPIDPMHPKLGWKGPGNPWTPIDSDAYYSMFCDYGMTKADGTWSPQRPVGVLNERGEREFRMPENTVKIATEAINRYTERRQAENKMVSDAVSSFADMMVEQGKLSRQQADEALSKTTFDERDSRAQRASEDAVKFSLVEDPMEIARLESEPKLEGYRNVSMQEDGSFRSPMADKLGKKGKKKRATEPFQLNRWERSDENPDLATDDGKINLGKPNGLGSVDNVDYNPYIHIRPTLVNKQFKNAWERPDLVYVRTLYPEGELTSGYQADKAKKTVGRHDWNGGELILSRWDKPVEIVPWERVADDWVAEFKDRGVEFDIVPPKLLPILAERGVEILPPHAGMGKRCNDAYEAWRGEHPDNPGGGVRFSLSETRTDEQGREVYTERRDDGTMDREVVTDQDGSKMVTWFDEEGRKKERLFYFPDGEVSKVVNWDDKGHQTRRIQYDRNRRPIAHWQRDTRTDWRLDENGQIEGRSNGEEIRPYNYRFSLSEDTQKIFDTAKRKFGETRDIREAGYVLPDGTMLDFSGRHELDPGSDSSHLAGSRHTDHRAINQIDFVYDENGDEVDTGVKSDMPDFIRRGAIRIDASNGLINLSVKPTAEQRKVLRQLIAENGGTVGVDFGDGWDTEHHVEYDNAKATRVLGDIDRYFDEGIKPQSNARFSLADDVQPWQSEQVSWERSALDHLLQNAANNEENRSVRSQAVKAVNSTLADLLRRISQTTDRSAYNSVEAANASMGAVDRAMRAQRGYDRWTVDSLVSMAKSMLKSGMYDGLNPYEVNRLIGKINQGAGRDEIQEQMNTVFDVLMNANLRGWDKQLRKLTSIRDVRLNSHGVRVMGQVDKMGSVMLRSMRSGMELSQEDLERRIAEVSDRLASDNSIDADNAAVEMEGLILAQQYNDLIGKYDTDNKAIKDQVREQLEKIYDFWREPNLDEEGNIKYRKDGLMSTTEKRRLKPEFGGVDENGNRQPMTEEAKRMRQQVERVVASLESARRENQVRMSEGYAELTNALGGGVAAAVTRAKEFRENEKLRKQEIYHAANSDLMGVDNNTEAIDPSEQVSPANWSFVRGLLGPLSTFEKMMRFFGRRSANGEGRLFNMFVRRQIDCSDNEWRSKKAGMDEMDNKAKELFGKKWMTIGNEMRDGKKFPPITLHYYDRTAQPRDIELRQDEAVYLYCVNKMRDGQMKLETMGIDDAMVEQIVQQLDPRLIQLADWYQGEFLPKRRDYYNQVYERMFGTPMARIENYIHLNINKNETAGDKEIGEPIGDQRGPSYVTGSIKERKTNVTPIELRTSIFDLAWSEHDKMEHWAAWGEYSRDLKDLINYRNFKAKVRNMKSVEFGNGKELLDNFSRCAAIVTGDYDNPGRHAKIDRAATNLAKGVTSAKIGFRAFTALKQTLSFPAFFSDARPDDLLFAMGNTEGTIGWAMENLPGFSKRWQSRQAGDTRLMETDSDWKVWKNSAVKTIGRYSMLPNASVDCMTVAIGARGVYRTAKRRYLSYGYTEAQADKKALQDAAISYNASQQSSEGAFTSAQQVDRTLAGVATTVFRNASMGYERRFTQGIRNLKRMAQSGYREEVIENTKKQMMEDGLTEDEAQRAAERVYNRMKWHSMADVVNFGFVLPFFWNLGPAMVYILGGEDDEQKKELVRDSALHALYGPIEGLSMGGTMSELANIITGSMLMDEKSLKETMQGLKHRNFNPLPIISDMQSIFNSFGADNWSGVNDVFNLLVQMGVGVNPETVTNMTWGIIDACQGDMDLSKKAAFAFLRFINAPASQVDKLYMDELGITKDEASRMSWEELAKKYARYHAVKDATVIAPFLPDEAEEAREEKYVKKFYDRAAELMEKADDADLGRVYSQGDEARKMVAKAKAKQEGLDEERFSKKPNSNAKESTKKGYDTYSRKRSYSDMAEDILLQKAEEETKANGDDERAGDIKKVLDNIAKKCRGDEKKGVKGMGVDRDTDERILKEIREARKKALKELKITR